MAHRLLKPMAIILGLMNAAAQISFATFVLFAQEVMNAGPLIFTVIFFGAAIGGLVGGNAAPAITRRFGSGTTLACARPTSRVTCSAGSTASIASSLGA